MELLIGSLSILVCVLLVLLFKRQASPASPADSALMLGLQQHVESLRADVRASLQHVTENVNRQLAAVTGQLQSQTSSVGSRLDSAARLMGDVQRNLGELGKATLEIKELGQGVMKLEELLRAPKLRGGLGEFLLEDILKQVLPAAHFEMQHRFRNGQIVDAVIRTSDRMVPVDSKFPLENFRKNAATADESEKRAYQKAFIGDLKKHIDAIAAKYILPDEGTFPFALMYIPAENIYYEVIIKDDGSNGAGLYDYALEKRVIPVSPNSFYAYLQVIALGLRGLSIEQSAREILSALGRLQGDVGRVREVFDTLGTHLENARRKYAEADKRLAAFEGRLETIGDGTAPAERVKEGRSPGLPGMPGIAQPEIPVLEAEDHLLR
jgi:DNA recombination protein RmuC